VREPDTLTHPTRENKRVKTILLLIPLLLLAACSSASQPHIRASTGVIESINTDDSAGFARATQPRTFTFPHDHGPHPDYQIEWWYYTGNLHTETGRHFGYQLTFFRRGIVPQPPQRASNWSTSNIYMAHLALSDSESGQFYAFDRFSRDGAHLAGAQATPYHIFLEDWSATGSGPGGMQMHLKAAEEDIALDLVLDSLKPPVLQGENGLSQKGDASGNASYYYSLTRMETSGTLRVDGKSYQVHGLSWMDHEFGTSGLDKHAEGWDWFSIQLDHGYEVMLYYIRLATPTEKQPGKEAWLDSAYTRMDGTLVLPDGTSRRLDTDNIAIAVLDSWRSPDTTIRYPAGWHITLPAEGLELEIEPTLPHQELLTAIIYWEGSVQARGTHQGQAVRGHGYVELTGYTPDTQ
jgi:predicted secreted hydrolase